MRTQNLDITGKHYRIYADSLEPEALEQFESAMAQPFAVSGALMPDAHKGYSLPIGAVVATEGVIVPSWVGYDIGCGMCAVPTSFDEAHVREKAKAIFEGIYEVVPTGYHHNSENTDWAPAHIIPRSDKMQEIFAKDGLKQLGSLGGGNHFIEVGVSSLGRVWVIVHSGSRGIGHAAATHYMQLASGDGKAREGHLPLSIDSADGKNYITDLDFCLRFSQANRFEIADRVANVMAASCPGKADWKSVIDQTHNHAEKKDGLWIHRKGASRAEQGERGVIPGNMKDGTFIVRGRGRPEALWSSSHGAGRRLGRNQAKRELEMDAFVESMNGVTAKVSPATIDESPAAYKDIFAVMELQKDLVTVLSHVRPIINIKG